MVLIQHIQEVVLHQVEVKDQEVVLHQVVVKDQEEALPRVVKDPEVDQQQVV